MNLDFQRYSREVLFSINELYHFTPNLHLLVNNFKFFYLLGGFLFSLIIISIGLFWLLSTFSPKYYFLAKQSVFKAILILLFFVSYYSIFSIILNFDFNHNFILPNFQTDLDIVFLALLYLSLTLFVIILSIRYLLLSFLFITGPIFIIVGFFKSSIIERFVLILLFNLFFPSFCNLLFHLSTLLPASHFVFLGCIFLSIYIYYKSFGVNFVRYTQKFKPIFRRIHTSN